MSFAALDHRQRDLWHGLITVADDQGRVLGVPANVRSEVWPMDDVTLEQVDQDLGALIEEMMILIYQVKNRPIIQIVNWWIYQAKQWAGPSDWPPPEGWVDRLRYHGAEHKIIIENWDQDGGFGAENHLENQVEHDLGNSVNEGEGEDDKEVKEVEVPTSLDGWLASLRDGSNKPAILRAMIETLYPEAVEYPDYGYIGSVARKVGGAGRLAALLWEVVPRRPAGDLLAYVQAMTRNQKQQDEPASYGALREYAEEELINGN